MAWISEIGTLRGVFLVGVLTEVLTREAVATVRDNLAMSAAARTDVTRQKRIDADWPATQDTLHARMVAVVGAQDALARGEPAAPYALRQSLVDLAAISELLAAELPAPRSPR